MAEKDDSGSDRGERDDNEPEQDFWDKQWELASAGVEDLSGIKIPDSLTNMNPMDMLEKAVNLSKADSLTHLIFLAAMEYVKMTGPSSSSGESGQVNSAAGAGTSELTPAQDGPVTIFEDIASLNKAGLDYSCAEYLYLGQCFQLKMSLPPYVTSEAVAQNFSPELQVEVSSRMNTPDESFLDSATYAPTDSWSGGMLQYMGAFITRLIDFKGGLKGQVMETQTTINQSEPKTVEDAQSWREAMVIGNPSKTAFISMWQSMPGYCSGNSVPYQPYYHSGLDQLSWRLLATTESVVLAFHSLDELAWNSLGGTGTSLFPRLGVIDTNNQYAASLTAAARAASIVNETDPLYSGLSGLHVALPALQYSGGSVTSKPDYRFYDANQSLQSLKFREIYPKKDEVTCRGFNYTQSEVLSNTYDFNRTTKEGSLGMKIYKPFVCCSRVGKYLFTVAMPPTIGRK